MVLTGFNQAVAIAAAFALATLSVKMLRGKS